MELGTPHPPPPEGRGDILTLDSDLGVSVGFTLDYHHLPTKNAVHQFEKLPFVGAVPQSQDPSLKCHGPYCGWTKFCTT